MKQDIKKWKKSLGIAVFAFLPWSQSLAQPIISGFTPTSGPIGTTVNISGSNFDPIASNNIVYFGAVKANIISAGSNSISVTVPFGTTYEPITVTTNGLTAYSILPFTVSFTGGGDFNTKIDFPTGVAPRGIVISDLDGDGLLDATTANSGGNSISVFRNNSSGGSITFDSRLDFSAGSSCADVLNADIDGDGKIDILAYNGTANFISVYKNTSSIGAISLIRQDLATGLNASSLSVGDVDGDGKPDIVVTYINFIGIFRNTSSGGVISFAPELQITIGVGITIQNNILADIDGDGKSDIIIGNRIGHISIFRNTSSSGIISFQPRLDFPASFTPYFVTVSDIDGDGKLDIASTSNDETGHTGLISVFLNKSLAGNISLAPGIDYPSKYVAWDIASGDVTGDGKPDLVTVINDVPGTISILKNSGTPGNISFDPSVDYSTTMLVWGVKIADLNNDGRPELISVGGNPGSFTVFLNQDPVPLPVTLINFKAHLINKKTNLFWETSMEQNVSFFSIERSADSGKFNSVGMVASTNHTNGDQYKFVDITDVSGTVYYRLKMVDKDNKFKYSPIVNVQTDDNMIGLKVYPNPANDHITIHYPLSFFDCKISIVDFNGRVVHTESVRAGMLETTISIKQLAGGIYTLVWERGDKKLSRTILLN